MPAPSRSAALRTPHVARALLTSLLARLPTAMATLALLLLLSPRYGYAYAGVGCTVYVGASALTNPLLSRTVDARGARAVLLPSAALNAAGLVVVALVAGHGLPLAYAAAAVAGAAQPPITAVVRGLWPRMLPAEQVPVLFGLEATAQELIYISGPALLALIAGGFGASAALVVTAALGLVGAVALVATPVFAAAPPGRHIRERALLRSSRLVGWLAVGASMTAAFGMSEVAVVAFVAPGHAGGTTESGVVLAVWSAGSMVGGLVFGRRERQVTDASVLLASLALAGATALPALAVDTVMLCVLVFVAGVTIAPGLARLYTRLSAAAPAAAQTETFGWLAVAFIVGSSAGSSLGGLTVAELGARAALALAAGPPLLGTAAGYAVHRRLRRRSGRAPAGEPARPVASRT
jgi:MFS family permease